MERIILLITMLTAIYGLSILGNSAEIAKQGIELSLSK